MKKNFSKFTSLIFILMMLTALSISLIPIKAIAADPVGIPDIPADCSEKPFGRCLNTGYFTGSIDRDNLFIFPYPQNQIYNDPCGLVTSVVGWAFPEAACTNPADPRDNAYTETFISTIKNDLDSYCNTFPITTDTACALKMRRGIGAASLMLMMQNKQGTDFGTAVWSAFCPQTDWWTWCYNPKMVLGVEYAKAHFDEWAVKVRDYNNAGRVKWNNFEVFNANHLNSTAANWNTDVQFFRNTDSAVAMTIEFLDTDGKPLFQINRVCGNVLGFPVAPPDIPHPTSNESYTSPIANASFSPDKENPTTATFTTGIAMTGNSYSVDVKREFYIIKAGTTAHIPIPSNKFTVNPGATPLNGTFTASKNPIDTLVVNNPVTSLGLQAGDQVCARTTVSPQHIKVDSSGVQTTLALTSPGADTTGDACDTLRIKPYVSVFGSDVQVGGSFANVSGFPSTGPVLCNNYPQSGIKTYNRGGLGSGSQFAAFAIGSPNDNTSFKTSLFNSAQNLASQNFGAYFMCMPDYYAGAPGGGGAAADFALDTTKQQISDGTLASAANVNIPNGKHIFLYSDHDISIDHNITMDSNWTGLTAEQIPSFYLIVKGNINIKSTVTRLDGVYVSEPVNYSSGTFAKGEINTCGDATSSSDLYSLCGRQLEINGSFIAQNVKLLRTFGTLNSFANDYPYSGSAHACAGAFGGPRPACAAEVFKFNPGIFLGKAPLNGPGTPPAGDSYPFITTLPPVL